MVFMVKCMWNTDRTDPFLNWIKGLDDDAKEAIFEKLLVLRETGPSLGRPFVDTVKNSKHKNMKGLRIQNKLRMFRIFFAFDPERKIVLLIGGDKRGDKRFYEKMIPIADDLYDKHLQELLKEKRKP